MTHLHYRGTALKRNHTMRLRLSPHTRAHLESLQHINHYHRSTAASVATSNQQKPHLSTNNNHNVHQPHPKIKITNDNPLPPQPAIPTDEVPFRTKDSFKQRRQLVPGLEPPAATA